MKVSLKDFSFIAQVKSLGTFAFFFFSFSLQAAFELTPRPSDSGADFFTPSSSYTSSTRSIGYERIADNLRRMKGNQRRFARTLNNSSLQRELRQISRDHGSKGVRVIQGLYEQSVEKNLEKPLEHFVRQFESYISHGLVKHVRDVENERFERCMEDEDSWEDFYKSAKKAQTWLQSYHSRLKLEPFSIEEDSSSENIENFESHYREILDYIVVDGSRSDLGKDLDKCCTAAALTEGICNNSFRDSDALFENYLNPLSMARVDDCLIDYLGSGRCSLEADTEDLVLLARYSQGFAQKMANASSLDAEREVWLDTVETCAKETEDFHNQIIKRRNTENAIHTVWNAFQCNFLPSWAATNGGNTGRAASNALVQTVVPIPGQGRTLVSQCDPRQAQQFLALNANTDEQILDETGIAHTLINPRWLENVSYQQPILSPVRTYSTPEGGLDFAFFNEQGVQNNYIATPGATVAEAVFTPLIPQAQGEGVVINGAGTGIQTRAGSANGLSRRSRVQSVVPTQNPRLAQNSRQPASARRALAVNSRVEQIPVKGRALVQGSERNKEIRKIASNIQKEKDPVKNARSLAHFSRGARNLVSQVSKRTRGLSSAGVVKARRALVQNLGRRVAPIGRAVAAKLSASRIASAFKGQVARVRSRGSNAQVALTQGRVSPTGPDTAQIQARDQATVEDLNRQRAANEKKRKAIQKAAGDMKARIDLLVSKFNNVALRANDLIAHRKLYFSESAILSKLRPLSRKKRKDKVLALAEEVKPLDEELIAAEQEKNAIASEIQANVHGLDRMLQFELANLAGSTISNPGIFQPLVPQNIRQQLAETQNITGAPVADLPVPQNIPRVPVTAGGAGETGNAFFKVMDLFLPRAWALSPQKKLEQHWNFERAWAQAFDQYAEDLERHQEKLSQDLLVKKRLLWKEYKAEQKRIQSLEGFVELDAGTLMEMNMAAETIGEEVQDLLDAKAAGDLSSNLSPVVFSNLREARAETEKLEEALMEYSEGFAKSFPQEPGPQNYMSLIPALVLD